MNKEESIEWAKGEADIDGYGDEGAGYDYEVFAEKLEACGWVYFGDTQEPVKFTR